MKTLATSTLCLAWVLFAASALGEPAAASAPRPTGATSVRPAIPATRPAPQPLPQQATGARPASQPTTLPTAAVPTTVVPTAVEVKRHPIAAHARALLHRLALRSDQVQHWLRDARSQRNAARSRCLDRMLSQTHALERLGHKESEAIVASLRRSEAWTTPPHLTRLAVFSSRSVELLAEAANCGKQLSQHVRMPTSFRVQVQTPKLPPEPGQRQQSRVRSKPRTVRSAVRTP